MPPCGTTATGGDEAASWDIEHPRATASVVWLLRRRGELVYPSGVATEADPLARRARVLLVAYLLVPVVLTLSGSAPEEVLHNVYLVLRESVADATDGQVVVSRRQTEALLNVLMYLPLALLLRLSSTSTASSMLLVLLSMSSVGIEIAQFLLLPDRNPSLTDVLNNTAGAAIGLVVGADLRSRLTRHALSS